MMDWNTITAFLTVAMLILVARAYGPMLKRDGGEVDLFISHVARAAFWWSIGAVLRFGHWDIAHTVLDMIDPGHWPAYRDALFGINYNIVPNLMKVWGAYHLVKAKFYLLPPEAQARENWITAIWYPAEDCRPIKFWRRK